MLEPGTYIDSHWGHYQSVETIKLGMDLGYVDHALSEANLYALIEAYENNEDELTLINEHTTAKHELNNEGFTVAECVYEVADDVTNYINDNHVDTEQHWFGHHPDLGDVGVWEQEDDV